MSVYHTEAGLLRFAPASVLISLAGATLALLSSLVLYAYYSLLVDVLPLKVLPVLGWVAVALGVALAVAGVVVRVVSSDAAQIAAQVKKGLCSPSRGNPLHLKEGERLPRVKCADLGGGRYALTVSCSSCTVEDIAAASSAISSMLTGKFSHYAITEVDADIAHAWVKFCLMDVTFDRSITVKSVEELRQDSPTKLIIQQDVFLSLDYCGSVLLCAKTRSGKSTFLACILLQVLLQGPDNFGSEIILFDGKRAELSQLPHVLTLDSDGSARTLLSAMKHFANTIVTRQQRLNDLSRQYGDAIKWTDPRANMKVSLLCIDEYILTRSVFSARPEKGDDYCLATFENYLRVILTTGASAGCLCLLTTAQGSVVAGGLSSLLRDAFTTKVLLRPTIDEGRLLWDSEQLKAFPPRSYKPGDAWISSCDGVLDAPQYVHLPRMEFPVYRELGRLLKEYYDKQHPDARPAPLPPCT